MLQHKFPLKSTKSVNQPTRKPFMLVGEDTLWPGKKDYLEQHIVCLIAINGNNSENIIGTTTPFGKDFK
jgi:hypothetical protein